MTRQGVQNQPGLDRREFDLALALRKPDGGEDAGVDQCFEPSEYVIEELILMKKQEVCHGFPHDITLDLGVAIIKVTVTPCQ